MNNRNLCVQAAGNAANVVNGLFNAQDLVRQASSIPQAYNALPASGRGFFYAFVQFEGFKSGQPIVYHYFIDNAHQPDVVLQFLNSRLANRWCKVNQPGDVQVQPRASYVTNIQTTLEDVLVDRLILQSASRIYAVLCFHGGTEAQAVA